MKSGKPVVVFLVKDKTISIIGAGSLGTAVIEALNSQGHEKIIATRRSDQGLEELQQNYDVKASKNNFYAVENSDIVILGVKPYLIEEICKEIKPYAQGKLVISLAAAKSISEIEDVLGESRICRVMTGIFVKDEVAAYSFGSKRNEEDAEIVRYIFGNDAIEVEENALADRTWIACDTGLLAKEVENKIKSLEYMDENSARIMYAATLEAVSKGLRDGMTGNQIFDKVAGSGSFTEKLHNSLKEKGIYKHMAKLVKETIKVCK
ncbi:MAG: NAD(P)-binding domain-containing protein [archaeon]|nr:NAD(P)-binding domain-containing protein [Nanoarchaeota archaeon]